MSHLWCSLRHTTIPRCMLKRRHPVAPVSSARRTPVLTCSLPSVAPPQGNADKQQERHKREDTTMKRNSLTSYGLTLLRLALAMALTMPVSEQQINGTPGSQSATQVIDGKQISAPPLPFGGVIKESYKDSKPYWPPSVVPPKGAPNILLIMTDDAGYGVSSTFGGVIPTPTMDRVAKAGLRYTQFHTTALCSPTRAFFPELAGKITTTPPIWRTRPSRICAG